MEIPAADGPAARRARTATVATGATALLLATNGPSVYVSLFWLDRGISWLDWPFLYPFAAIAAAGLFLLARELRGQTWRQLPWPFVPIAGYAAWALLSALWSVSTNSTPTQALVGVGIAAFGCWFGWSLTFEEQVLSVAIATTVAVALSIVVVVLQPEHGRMPIPYVGSGGQWRGIFGNRNSLAPVALLGLVGLIGLFMLTPTIRRALLLVPIAVMHAVAMIKAESTTSLFALFLCALVLLAVPVVWGLQRRGLPGLLAGVGTAVVAIGGSVLLLRNLTAIANRFGRDPTLSNRRLIWADVREFIAVHPVRGYGFWGFWDREDLTAESYARLGGGYGSAHNSVLEVLLMLGVVGLIPFVLICVAALGGGCVRAWRERSLASWWWLVVLTFVVAESMTESFVLWHSYIWILLVAGALAPYGAVRERVLGADRGTTFAADRQAECP